MSEFKTYVLLEHMNPHNMNLFRRIGKTQRERIDKRKDYAPFLRSTITKPKIGRVVIRYKQDTDIIEQEEQVKKGILANAPFLNGEYSAMKFVYGTKTTNDPVIQKYLEEYAAFEGNENTSQDCPRKEYKLLDFKKEAKDLNAFTRRRVEAVNKILNSDLDATKELLWRAYGTYYKPTEDIEENQNRLIAYLDENEGAVDEIMKGDITQDDEVKILVGRALTMDILSFDANPGQVSKKKGTAWIDVKAISEELELNERVRQFSQFLTSDAGKLLREDIEADLGIVKEKTKKIK